MNTLFSRIYGEGKVKTLIFLLIVLNSPMVFAGGGDTFGNGGGLSENNLLFAWVKLKSAVQSVVYSRASGLTIPEAELLTKIFKSHDEEMRGAGIQFLSSQQNPGVFDADESGIPRTGVTGSEVGSAIYFNLERLYPVRDGVEQPIDYVTALGFLVHELGHHHGVKDHAFLDQLGGKVRDFVGSSRTVSVDLRRFSGNRFMVSAFSPIMLWENATSPIGSTFASVNVSNGLEVYDLSEYFERNAYCEGESYSFKSSAALDVTWLPFPAFNSVTSTQTIRASVTIAWDCNPWPNPGERRMFSQAWEISQDFKVMELSRVNITEHRLVESTIPDQWRSERASILQPVNDDWQIRELSCERINFNFEPQGPCSF